MCRISTQYIPCIHTYIQYIHITYTMYTRNCEYYIQHITHKHTVSAIQITHALCKCNAYDTHFHAVFDLCKFKLRHTRRNEPAGERRVIVISFIDSFCTALLSDFVWEVVLVCCFIVPPKINSVSKWKALNNSKCCHIQARVFGFALQAEVC